MLDGRNKADADRVWDRFGRVVARTGITANQVTLIGVVAVLAHCAAYPLYALPLPFAGGLGVLEELDNLDGAVARVTGTSSRLGAYLDAATDRYKDVAAIGVVGWVHDAHLAAFLAATGAVITSYNKARAGMEVPIDNAAWPDLFERKERLIVLIGGLALAGLVSDGLLMGADVVHVTLWILAVGTHFTALQRLLRAARLLRGQ